MARHCFRWSCPIVIALAVMLAGPALAASQEAIFVAPDGDDNGPGTADAPFATIRRGQSALERGLGRTIYLRGGTHALDETLQLGAGHSGISILAHPGERPVLDGAAAGLGTLVQVSGASNITLGGLGFVKGNRSGAALTLAGSTAIRVVGNYFRGNSTAILLDGASSNLVSANQIDASSSSAIEAKDGSNDNVFESNAIDGTGAVNTHGGGFFLHGANDNTITQNLVQNTAGAGILVSNWNDATINVGNAITYNIVRNANMWSNDSGSIYLLGRSHVDTKAVVRHNLIDGTGADGDAHTIGIYLDDSVSGVLVESNIIRNIGTHGAQIHGGDDNTFRNNIFDLGSGAASAVLFQAAPADTNPRNTMRNNRVAGNIIVSTNPRPTLYHHLSGGTPEITSNLYGLAGTATGSDAPISGVPIQDADARFGDPRFADAATGDYRLGPGSAAAGIGFRPIAQSRFGPRPDAALWKLPK